MGEQEVPPSGLLALTLPEVVEAVLTLDPDVAPDPFVLPAELDAELELVPPSDPPPLDEHARKPRAGTRRMCERNLRFIGISVQVIDVDDS